MGWRAEAPLLAGPVDVYVDGSLLTVASVERIDRGGTMHVGMGVEQRIRVGRNVRAREETAGILGGDAVVHHDVSIELASSLGQSALVEIDDAGAAWVVGIVQTRVPERLVLRASSIELEADREVLLRTGTAGLRLRDDGDVELVGGRIAATARGVFKLVGKILRLN